MTFLTKIENKNFDLLKELVKTRFKLRYNNSILGFVWVLMKPLLSFLIMFFVFGAFKNGGSDPAFAPNLFCGLILFYFLQEGITFGMNSLMDMANIILKINFPREIAVLSSIVMAIINLSINFVVIIIITVLTGFSPSLLGTLYFFFIILVILGLVYGITLFLSIIFVKVRDLTNVLELFFQLMFWGSAIFYNLGDMTGRTGDIIRMNPIAILIDAARRAFIKGEFAHVDVVLIIAGIVVLLIMLGRSFFNKNVKKIAEFF
jgi:ABC-2 type transport system permease protein